MTRTPAEILQGAIDEIRRHGWRRGGADVNKGPCCVFRAMVRGGGEYDHPAELGKAARIVSHLIKPWDHKPSWWQITRRIFGWNDAVCRNELEAIELLERARKALL